MNKVVKFLVGISFVFIILLIALVVLIPLLINPNDYKQQIEQQAADATGRQLTIDGDIDLSFSLPMSLSFELGKTSLGKDKAFDASNKAENFASVKQISLKASLLPLIQDNKLEIGEVLLDGLQLRLVKNKQGSNNWDSFSKGKETKQPTKASETESTDLNTLPEIHIKGVKVINTEIVYDDQMTSQKVELNNFSINISEIIANKPIELSVKTNFSHRAKVKDSMNEIKGDLSLSSVANFDLANGLAKLSNASISLNTIGQQIPGGKNNTTLSADIDVNLVKQTLDLLNIKLSSYDVNVNGQINVVKFLSAANYTGKFTIDEFSPKILTKNLAIELPEMKHEKALEKLSMSLAFSGNQSSIKLTSLETKLDEIVFSGEAAISNFASPSYTAKLNINQLIADDYALKDDDKIDSEKSKEVKTEVANKKSNKDVALIPVKLLRSLNVNSQLTIDRVVVSDIKMDNVVLTLKANKGVVKLSPIQSDFYKGKLKLDTIIDVTKNTPKINITQNFNKIDLGSLLFDVTKTQEFTGNATISSKLNTFGQTQKEFIKNSQGKGAFHINDGHIKKLDILHTIRKAQALVKGHQKATVAEEKNTAFTELKGTFKVNKGVVNNQDLFTKTPLMQVTGKGYADLPKEYLDYKLQVKILNTLKVDKNTGSTDFTKGVIPYRIKGKFNELSQEADLKGMIKDKVKEKAKAKVKEVLGDKLKGFLNF